MAQLALSQHQPLAPAAAASNRSGRELQIDCYRRRQMTVKRLTGDRIISVAEVNQSTG